MKRLPLRLSKQTLKDAVVSAKENNLTPDTFLAGAERLKAFVFSYAAKHSISPSEACVKVLKLIEEDSPECIDLRIEADRDIRRDYGLLGGE